MRIEGQCHFLTLVQVHLHLKIETLLRNHLVIFTKFRIAAVRYKEMKIHEYVGGHMTKMAVKPIYGKNLQKSFPEPID